MPKVPAKEKWLWENKMVLEQVKKGLHDSAIKNVTKRCNFSDKRTNHNWLHKTIQFIYSKINLDK